MKTRIFALLAILIIVICAAVPPPAPMREWINSWTTNRGIDPVMGSNNLAITNRISGAGGGTAWNFYGISPNTVARLTDSTNVARAVVGQSNGTWIAVDGGGGNDTKLTNTTEQFAITINHQSGDVLIIGAGLGGITTDGIADVTLDGSSSVAVQDSQGGGIFSFDGKLHLMGPTGGVTNENTLDVADTSQFFSDVYLRGSALHVYGDKSEFSNSVAFWQPTPGRLLSLDALNHLTNGPFSDATITSLTNAANGLTNLANSKQNGTAILTNFQAMGITNIVAGPGIILATNAGVLYITNSGQATALTFNPNQFSSGSGSVSLTNGFTGTNASLYGTVGKEAVGGTAIPFSVNDTNGATQFQIPTNSHGVALLGTNANGITTISNSPGRTAIISSNASASAIYQTSTGVGIGTNAPSVALEVVGAIKNSSDLTIGGNISATSGSLTLAQGGSITFNNRVQLNPISGGGLQLKSTSASDFSVLTFGGNTTTFPAWKRNGAGLDLTGGDGSYNSTNSLIVPGLITATNGIATLRSNLLAPTAITFPNSTVNWTNPLNCNIELYIDNTAVTGTAIKKNGTQIFGGLSNDVTMHLQPGEFFSESYSVGTPSATFSPF
jgi:hypothetical protein